MFVQGYKELFFCSCVWFLLSYSLTCGTGQFYWSNKRKRLFSGCVLILCPLDSRIWITSGRIKPLQSSRTMGSNIHIHLITHKPVQPVSETCVAAPRVLRRTPCESFQREFGLFILLSSPSPLAAAGPWLVTDPPALVCVLICCMHKYVYMCVCVCVLVCLCEPVCACQSPEGDKNIKIKIFYQNTDLNPHTYTFCTHSCTDAKGTLWKPTERVAEKERVRIPKSPFLWLEWKLIDR